MKRLGIIHLLLLLEIVNELQCRADRSSAKYQRAMAKYAKKGSSKKTLSLPIYLYTLESKTKPNSPTPSKDFNKHSITDTRELLFDYYTHVAKERFKQNNLSPFFGGKDGEVKI